MFARTFFLIVLVLCTVLAAAGAWIYARFPDIARQQAQPYLQSYGVADLSLTTPTLALDHARFERLSVSGERDNYRYAATIQGLELRYQWREALRAKPRGLVIDTLQVTIDQAAAAHADDAGAIRLSELLPHNISDLVPVANIEVRALQLSYRAPGLDPIQVTGHLQLRRDLSVQLDAHVLERDMALSLQLQDGAVLRATVDVGTDAKPVALKVAGQPGDSEQWRWQIEAAVAPGPLQRWYAELGASELVPPIPALQGLLVDGTFSLSADLRHPDALDFGADARGATWQALSAGLQFRAAINDLQYPPYVAQLQTELSGAAQLRDGAWRLQLEPATLAARVNTDSLELPEPLRAGIGWDAYVPLQWRHDAPLRLNARFPEGRIALNIRDGQLGVGAERQLWQLLALNLAASMDQGDNPALLLDVDARLHGNWQQQATPEIVLLASHSGPLERGRLHLTALEPSSQARVQLEGRGNLPGGEGSYGLVVAGPDLPASSTAFLPLILTREEPLTLPALSAGSLILHSEITAAGWQNQSAWQQRASLAVEGLEASYDTYRLRNGNLSARWHGIEYWQTDEPVTLSIEELQAAVPASNIRASLALSEPTSPTAPVVDVLAFSAETLGGRMYLPGKQRWTVGAATNQLQLQVSDWQLAELVALQQSQQLVASGTLEGSLPFSLADGRFIIESGFLKALPPGGIIRYTPDAGTDALAGSSEELGTALDLLRNFQFQVLATEVDLDREGNLLLQLSLGGRNPDQYSGRQVNFNINLEQNIDPLLQSLELSDSVVRQVEKSSQ